MNSITFILALQKHCVQYVEVSRISSSLDGVIKLLSQLDLKSVTIDQEEAMKRPELIIESLRSQLKPMQLMQGMSMLTEFKSTCDDMATFLSKEIGVDMHAKNMLIVPILCATCPVESIQDALNVNFFKLKDDNTPWVDGESVMKYIIDNHKFNVDLSFLSNLMNMFLLRAR